MIRIWKRLALTATIAVATVGTVGVAQVSAGPLPCAARTLSKAFSQWGDQNDYFVIADGTFETGASSWSLSRGIAVSMNQQEPWKVNGATHTVGLSLPSGTRARAPKTCLEVGEEYFRFFYRGPASKNATMVVTVESVNAVARASSSVSLTSNGTTDWMVSPPIAIPNVLGEKFKQEVDISFQVTGGTWAIDDVMIDPFKVR